MCGCYALNLRFTANRLPSQSNTGGGAGEVSPDGAGGAAPLRQSSTKTPFQPPSAASGAAQPPRPQGRGLPQEARAARSLRKAKFDISATRSNGGVGAGEVSPDGAGGAAPLRQSSTKTPFQPPSAASGAAQPPRPQGRGLPQEARAARSLGKAKFDISATRSNGGSGDVSPDGVAGAEPLRRGRVPRRRCGGRAPSASRITRGQRPLSSSR